LYVFLWERHLAAMIVAGSHSHKGKNFTLLGAIFLTYSKILSKESSHFANMPDQGPAQDAQFFARIFIEKNIWTRIGAILAGNQSLKINCDNGLLILATLNFGFGRCNYMPRSGPWEIRPSSNMWHAGCLNTSCRRNSSQKKN
jgi:hypothetical protein